MKEGDLISHNIPNILEKPQSEGLSSDALSGLPVETPLNNGDMPVSPATGTMEGTTAVSLSTNQLKEQTGNIQTSPKLDHVYQDGGLGEHMGARA